jgi:excisionase family DNA binding protein
MGTMKTAVQLAADLPNPDSWCDITDAVKLTGLSRQGIYGFVADGRLKDYRIGRHRVFWRADVVALADAVKLTRKPIAS